jgi:hypothetical protein
LVAVFVIRRLLGIDRGRWLITVGAVLAGEAAATAIVSAVYGGVSEVPAAGIVAGWALVTVFAMLVVVLVELEEGTRIVSNLSDVDAADVTIGMPVEAFIEHFDSGVALPLFRPRRTS